MKNLTPLILFMICLIAKRVLTGQIKQQQEELSGLERQLQKKQNKQKSQQDDTRQQVFPYNHNPFKATNTNEQNKSKQSGSLDEEQNSKQYKPNIGADIIFVVIFVIAGLSILIPCAIVCIVEPLYHKITGKHLPCFRPPTEPTQFFTHHRGFDISAQEYSRLNYKKSEWKTVADQKAIDPTALCSICLDQCCNVKLSCDHFFHLKCICEWIKKNASCPVCRISQFKSNYYCIYCCGQYFCLKCLGQQHYLEFQSVKELMMFYIFDQNGYECGRECSKQGKKIVYAKGKKQRISQNCLKQNILSNKYQNKQIICMQDLQAPQSQRPMSSHKVQSSR